ncbi:hypothetical protein B0I35DRAFT_412677 [Stachybotrys elegans]|uniref:Uncharacterized protein n=1 Tax=Stachybotrys elegans TaxID=80388 RepID=A0A8K0SKA4_9HYPO|nr:hypothetical protein B0I35DRAFT_412677 [Stachybotrys elegans]
MRAGSDSNLQVAELLKRASVLFESMQSPEHKHQAATQSLLDRYHSRTKEFILKEGVLRQDLDFADTLVELGCEKQRELTKLENEHACTVDFEHCKFLRRVLDQLTEHKEQILAFEEAIRGYINDASPSSSSPSCSEQSEECSHHDDDTRNNTAAQTPEASPQPGSMEPPPPKRRGSADGGRTDGTASPSSGVLGKRSGKSRFVTLRLTKRQRLEAAAIEPVTDKTIEFDQVYQEGRAAKKYTIAHFPRRGDGYWYILECAEHGEVFNGQQPWFAASRHVHSKHINISADHASTVREFGTRVLNCNSKLAEMNNAALSPKAAGPKGQTSTPLAASIFVSQPRPTSTRRIRSDSGIQNPGVGDVYVIPWGQLAREYAAVILPMGDFDRIGLKGSISTCGLHHDPRNAFKFDEARKQFRWRKRLSRTGSSANLVMFPVMYFDNEESEEGNYDWVAGQDLRTWTSLKGLPCSSIAEEYIQKRDALGTARGRFLDAILPSNEPEDQLLTPAMSSPSFYEDMFGGADVPIPPDDYEADPDYQPDPKMHNAAPTPTAPTCTTPTPTAPTNPTTLRLTTEGLDEQSEDADTPGDYQTPNEQPVAEETQQPETQQPETHEHNNTVASQTRTVSSEVIEVLDSSSEEERDIGVSAPAPQSQPDQRAQSAPRPNNSSPTSVHSLLNHDHMTDMAREAVNAMRQQSYRPYTFAMFTPGPTTRATGLQQPQLRSSPRISEERAPYRHSNMARPPGMM